MEESNSPVFNRFYSEYYKRSYLFAKSYVHNDWAAEDIASESLIKLWETYRIEPPENPKSLLFTILKNKALDYLKHEMIKENALSSMQQYSKRELEIRISTLEASDPDKIFAKDIQEIIHKALLQLPTQTREIFTQNKFKYISKKEIADKYGITIKGVDYHLSKALKCLREELKDYFPIILFLFL